MNFIITKEQYLAAKTAWKSNKEHSAAELLTYNLLRGFPLERGFTPFKETNKNKIDSNNCDRWNGFNQALYTARNSVSFRETSDEFFLKKYGREQKHSVSFFDKIRGVRPQPDTITLPDYAIKYQEMAISNNKIDKDKFQKIFGLELTEELSILLKAVLAEDKRKK